MGDGNLLFIGVKGSALALDRATGEIVWTTPLAGTDFVYVTLADGALYASARGEMFCLDPATGTIRWRNALKGYGWGIVSIATADGGQVVLAREKAAGRGGGRCSDHRIVVRRQAFCAAFFFWSAFFSLRGRRALFLGASFGTLGLAAFFGSGAGASA